MMKTRAAVAVAAGQPLEVMDVNLEGPKRGEVLIEIKATGLCHTDEFTRSGDDPEGIFPAILGHEGAGVVLEVGEGVTTLEVGDHDTGRAFGVQARILRGLLTPSAQQAGCHEHLQTAAAEQFPAAS